jgi:hypothetical protein
VLWLDVPEERRGDFDADLARTFESWRDEDGMTRLDVAVRYTLGRR